MTEVTGNESDSEALQRSADRTVEERVAALEERLKQVDDAVIVRVLAVMDVADELHRQSNERINQLDERLNQLTNTVDRLAALVSQSIENADADRAIIRDNQTEIRRIWEYLLRQHPNGSAER